MTVKQIHIIANSHMDPVWIWNRSSGRRAWNNTITTTVRLMKKYPEMTFTCSASTLYRWLEETEPVLFADIRELVAEGRWEITGGWEVQSDTIISTTESLIRQAVVGKRYFQDKFGVDVKTAYNVDAFGHSHGLPKILKATGFDNYVFVRSQQTPSVFTWKSNDGSSVTAHRVKPSYCIPSNMTRESFFNRIGRLMDGDFEEQTFFFGIGDHGGSLSEQYIAWAKEAAKEYPLVFSSLTEFFKASEPLPKEEFTGELGPVFTGCYSACHTVKKRIAGSMKRLLRAEALGGSETELEETWREMLLSHFHDILPGTSIREAYERDIYPALGLVDFKAEKIIDRQMARLSAAADTMFMPEGGIYALNINPYPMHGTFSLPAFTDPNSKGTPFDSLADKDGNVLPLQILSPPTSYGPCGVSWGRLTAVVPMEKCSGRFLALSRTGKKFPALGITRQEKLLEKLSFQVYHDDYGTWGFGLERFSGRFESPVMENVQKLFDGPVCSSLRAVYRFRDSSIRLDLTAFRDVPEIRMSIKTCWREKQTALKLAVAHGLEAKNFHRGQSGAIQSRDISDIPGNTIWVDSVEKPLYRNFGECAMVDWCALEASNSITGFYSSDLHGCDLMDNTLRLTLLRCVPYSDHKPFPANTEDGYIDEGTGEFELWSFEYSDIDVASLPALAQIRLNNIEACEVSPHAAGKPCPMPEIPELSSKNILLESCRTTSDGNRIFHVSNNGDKEETVRWKGQRIAVPPHAIILSDH